MAGWAPVKVPHQLLGGVLGVPVEQLEQAEAREKHERALRSLEDRGGF